MLLEGLFGCFNGDPLAREAVLYSYDIGGFCSVISNFLLYNVLPPAIARRESRIGRRVVVVEHLPGPPEGMEACDEESSVLSLSRCRFYVSLGPRLSRVWLVLSRKAALDAMHSVCLKSPIIGRLGRILHSVLEQYLCMDDATFLHGSALALRGEAVLVSGQPGLGKTYSVLEASRLFDAPILSDDQPLATRDGLVCSYPDDHTLHGYHSQLIRSLRKRLRCLSIAALNRLMEPLFKWGTPWSTGTTWRTSGTPPAASPIPRSTV